MNNEDQRLKALSSSIQSLKQQGWNNSILNRIEKIGKKLAKGEKSGQVIKTDQGTGKSTSMCGIALPDDALFFKNHAQAADKRDILDQMGKDYCHFFSIETMIELETEDKSKLGKGFVIPNGKLEKKFTQEVIDARQSVGFKELKEMKDVLEETESDRAVKAKFDNEITENYSDKYRRFFDEGENNSIWISSHRNIELFIDQYVSRRSEGALMVDESLWGEPSGWKFGLQNFDSIGLEQDELEQIDYVSNKRNIAFNDAKRAIEILTKRIKFLDIKKKNDAIDFGEKGYVCSISASEVVSKSSIRQRNIERFFLEYCEALLDKSGDDPLSPIEHEIVDASEDEQWEKVSELESIRNKFQMLNSWLDQQVRSGKGNSKALIVKTDTSKNIRFQKPKEVDLIKHGAMFREYIIANAEFSKERWKLITEERSSFNWEDVKPEIIGKRNSFDAQILNVKPRENKNTFINDMEDKKRWKRIYKSINKLAKNTDKTVGVIASENIEKHFCNSVNFLYWGNTRGRNKLKDVDRLFIFSAPRLSNKDWLLQSWLATEELPDESVDELRKIQGDALVGFNDDNIDLMYRDQVHRMIRDAVGRMRSQTQDKKVFQIGIPSTHINYSAQISYRELRGQIALDYGVKEWKKVTPWKDLHYPFRGNQYLTKTGVSLAGITKSLGKWQARKEVKKKLKENVNDPSRGTLEVTLTRNF